jgi:acyl carrier protein
MVVRMRPDIGAAIRCFISESLGLAVLADDVRLLSSRAIDSTGVLELVCFLEGAFGIEVADEEILTENLDSVRAICAYVDRKLAWRARERLQFPAQPGGVV